jgi:protein-tyrosine phosphatase
MKKSIVCLLCAATIGAMGGCSLISGGASKQLSVISLTITKGKGEVYPYVQEMANYLHAPKGMDVARYAAGNIKNQAKAVELAWECNSEVEKFVLSYGIAGSSKKTKITLSGDTYSYELFNLFKGTEYEWSVTARSNDGAVSTTATATFKTTDVGPRVLQIEGIYNTRDLGGYKTESGKRTKQGLIYRGGALLPAGGYDSDLTSNGKLFMAEVLQIKTDFDLRGEGAEVGNILKSPIPNAALKYIATDGYASAFRITENFRQVFSFLANEENYPIYMHCTGGADRTGTVSFLFNALLGVSETELIQDYEITTFSIYSTRSTQSGPYAEMFQEFLNKLYEFEGETLSQKTENYMLSIGVTADEIASIRSIMIEE